MGRSLDIATSTHGDTRYANVSGDTFTGAVNVNTSTSANLTVNSGVYGGIQFQNSGTNTGYITSYTDGAGNESMYMGGADKVNIHTGTNHALTNGTTRLQINAAGQVTTPNQPVFQAYDLASGASNINQVFPFTRINEGNHYSTSTGRFTAPVAGKYIFGFGNIANSTNRTYRYYIRKNGSNFHGHHLRIDTNETGSAYGTNATYTFPLALNASDYVNVYYIESNGGAGTEGGDYAIFWGYLIG